MQDICTLVNFQSSDCPPSLRGIDFRVFAKPVDSRNHVTEESGQFPYSSPVVEPEENTFNRPSVMPRSNQEELDHDSGSLQHYHRFDRQHSARGGIHRRPNTAFQFIGIHNGTRRYRRIRPSIRIRTRLPSQLSEAAVNNGTDNKYIWLRGRNGKLVKLKRRTGEDDSSPSRTSHIQSPNNLEIRHSQHRGFRRFRNSGSDRLRNFDRSRYPLLRRTRSQKMKKILARRRMGKMNSSKNLESASNVGQLSTESPKRLLNRFRRLRLLKRMRNLARQRKLNRTSMFRTLLQKLVQDAQRYAYETVNSTNDNESTFVLPEKLDAVESRHFETNGTASNFPDYEFESIFDEIGILANESLSPSEKYVALLRMKMMTNMEEAVIPLQGGVTDASLSDSIQPMVIDILDTDFVTPSPLNLSSWLENDLSLSGVDIENIWLLGNISEELNTFDIDFDEIMNVTNSLFHNDFGTTFPASENVDVQTTERNETIVAGILRKNDREFLTGVNISSSPTTNINDDVSNPIHSVNGQSISEISSSVFLSPTSEESESNLVQSLSSSTTSKPDQIPLPTTTMVSPATENNDQTSHSNIEENDTEKTTNNEDNTETNVPTTEEVEENFEPGEISNLFEDNPEIDSDLSFDYSNEDIKLQELLSKLDELEASGINNDLSKGSLNNLPMPLVTLIVGVHILM